MAVVRDYGPGDAGPICRLFYETVRTVNLGDYSPEQVRAWAPEIPDPAAWHERMSGRHTLVADEGGEVVGFAELEESGHLDMLYCRADAVGRGVGSLLYAAVERRARGLGLARISTEARHHRQAVLLAARVRGPATEHRVARGHRPDELLHAEGPVAGRGWQCASIRASVSAARR